MSKQDIVYNSYFNHNPKSLCSRWTKVLMVTQNAKNGNFVYFDNFVLTYILNYLLYLFPMLVNVKLNVSACTIIMFQGCGFISVVYF